MSWCPDDLASTIGLTQQKIHSLIQPVRDEFERLWPISGGWLHFGSKLSIPALVYKLFGGSLEIDPSSLSLQSF
jgi:hypothetical protein